VRFYWYYLEKQHKGTANLFSFSLHQNEKRKTKSDCSATRFSFFVFGIFFVLCAKRPRTFGAVSSNARCRWQMKFIILPARHLTRIQDGNICFIPRQQKNYDEGSGCECRQNNQNFSGKSWKRLQRSVFLILSSVLSWNKNVSVDST